LSLLKPRSWMRRSRLALLGGLFVAVLMALAFMPRIPIGPHYHDFADKRTLWGTPNALDVFSNIPFVLVGVWGLVWLFPRSSSRSFVDQRERIPWVIFFAGVTLTGFGSYWYHLAPSNARLPWDLLPMTCSFLSIVAATYMERIDLKSGLAALFPLLLLGIASVTYWYLTAADHHGDYKFYLLVQFFSPVLLALMIGLFPPRYSGTRYLVIAFGLYVLAKLFETYDYPIFNSGHIVSGHALKHVTAAISCGFILRMLQVRRPMVSDPMAGDRAEAGAAKNLTYSQQ